MSVSIKNLILGPLQANAYIITDLDTNECAVIDPGEYNEELINAVKDKNVKYIMLTHGHFDHILGVHALKELTCAKVAVHTEDADCLKDGRKSLAFSSGLFSQHSAQADILLNDGGKLMLGNTEFTVMHTPGHTKGGVCYIIESEKIIFTGDTLFSLTAGRTDFEGGSFEELMNSLEKIARLDGDYKVYTGHNRSTTLDFERQHNRYLRRIK